MPKNKYTKRNYVRKYTHMHMKNRPASVRSIAIFDRLNNCWIYTHNSQNAELPYPAGYTISMALLDAADPGQTVDYIWDRRIELEGIGEKVWWGQNDVTYYILKRDELYEVHHDL